MLAQSPLPVSSGSGSPRACSAAKQPARKAVASRRDAEQLLHPDPSRYLAQQRQRDQIEAWIAKRQLQHPSPAMADPQRPPPRRWLLIGTQRLPQCFLYRVEQKQEQLKALGWTSRVLREEELSALDRDRTLGWADVVILCRLEVSPDLLDWIRPPETGAFLPYDIDDLLFDPPQSAAVGALRVGSAPAPPLCLDQALITTAMLCCDAVVVSSNPRSPAIPTPPATQTTDCIDAQRGTSAVAPAPGPAPTSPNGRW